MTPDWRSKHSTDSRRELTVTVVSPSAGFGDEVAGLLVDDGLSAATDRIDALHGDEAVPPADVVMLGPGARIDADEVRRLRRTLPDATPIVVVLAPQRRNEMRGLLEAGAAAIVPEPAVDTTLALTVRAVVAGLMVVPEEHRHTMSPPSLSHRERQVLGLVAAGLTNEEIARRLYLAESTVKGYLTSAFQRLGVHSRREAASLVLGADDALRRRLTAPPHPDDGFGAVQSARSIASAT